MQGRSTNPKKNKQKENHTKYIITQFLKTSDRKMLNKKEKYTLHTEEQRKTADFLAETMLAHK